MRNALVRCTVDDPAMIDTPQDWALAVILLLLVIGAVICIFGRD